jgi:hypothetical protein
MAFRGKFTFGTEEEAPTQQYQQQWQGGQMAPYQQNPPTTFGFGQRQPVRHQAGDERFVSTVTYSETRTNDTGISLQKAANRQADGANSNLLNLIVGGIFAIAIAYVGQPILMKSLEVFAVLVLVGFAVGFFMFYNAFKAKGGGDR